MYSGGNVLVPATGFGPIMGTAFLAGYPTAAAIVGVLCAGVIVFLLMREQKQKRSFE